jgi:hypothetical protein
MAATEGVPLTGLDEAQLRELVPLVLQSGTAELVSWRWERLQYGGSNPVSGGLYRFAGMAHDGGETVPWSLILKVVCSPTSLDEEGSRSPVTTSDAVGYWNYWQREVLAYQSGILDDLNGGLAAPRCYGATAQPDGTVWLWLEEIREESTGTWSMERYGLAARHLGAWQGAFLVGRPLPDAPWLAQGWLRSWRASSNALLSRLAADEAAWDHPRAQQAFGRPLRAPYQRLAAEEAAWLDVLDTVPQTLCHYDFLRPNLFARRRDGQEETVAIDWSYVGHGPVGEDAALLVSGSLLRPEMPVTEVVHLDQMVFGGYLMGLRAAGWHGDPGLIRMSFGMAAAMHSALNLPLLVLLAVTDETSHAWMEQQWGHPIGQLVPQWGALSCYLLDLADEARGLLARHARQP